MNIKLDSLYNSEQESTTGIINIPNFELHNKATVIKTTSFQHKNRQVDQ